MEVKESREGSKLCAFNIDFQDIDEIVTIVLHEPSKAPHLDAHVGTMVVDGAKCPRLEMGSVREGLEFRAPLESPMFVQDSTLLLSISTNTNCQYSMLFIKSVIT